MVIVATGYELSSLALEYHRESDLGLETAELTVPSEDSFTVLLVGCLWPGTASPWSVVWGPAGIHVNVAATLESRSEWVMEAETLTTSNTVLEL